MTNQNSLYCCVSIFVCLLAGCGSHADLVTYDEVKTRAVPEDATVVCRLFFQDHDTKQLRWADVIKADEIQLGEVNQVAGFPELDPDKQNLVQMDASGPAMLVGVRDDDGGEFQSGYVLVATGVVEEAHGDHSHWNFDRTPSVRKVCLDENQGNPAHLYLYQDVFYLANDRKNGYTRIDPLRIADGDSDSAACGFHSGGGNHITLAVADNSTGYGTWIDGGGPNAGRVDVTEIKPEGNQTIAYSFNLPSGAIHGATTVAGKIFFAPAEGVCWVNVDPNPSKQHPEVEVHKISLGADPETKKPLRTGAFTVHRDYVLFVNGKADFAALSLLNAAKEQPSLINVQIPMDSVNSPTVPRVVKTAAGRRLAFLFHNHKADVKGGEFLSVVDLDPNGDLDFSDAKLEKTIPVGASAVEGHYGHHDLTWDHAGRFAFWTNPGEGTISVMSLDDLAVNTTITVGGKPTKVVGIGEEDIDD